MTHQTLIGTTFSSMMCNEECPCNIMPADIVANGIILLGYERGLRHEKKQV